MKPEKIKKAPTGDVLKYGEAAGVWWENSNHGGEDAYKMFQFKLKDLGVPLNKDTKVLEVGSGNAMHLNALRDHGVDVVGVDARPRGESGPQVAARVEQLPFQDEAFDVVVGIAVFDTDVYNQDQAMMFKDVARVLKKGGVFIASAGSIDTGVVPKNLQEVTERSWRGFERVYKKV
jgi:ubiquinone/menaquinone biosynthesis C-methylase UbiE